VYSTDVIVIGAGVVGLAIARNLAKSGLEVIVLEKENSFGFHTSSRNSEVIHAGIYYQKGSLKAQLCMQGKHLLYDYCRKNHIEHQRVGKYIVATDDHESEILETIIHSARTNGVNDLERVNNKNLSDRYPQLKITDALFSPSTGIIDSHGLMNSLIGEIESYGSNLAFNTKVTKIKVKREQFDLTTAEGTTKEGTTKEGTTKEGTTKEGTTKEETSLESTKINCKYLINSAGLWAGDVAELLACNESYKKKVETLFVRGRYLSYQGSHDFKHLIYPVPVKGGLGTHLTLDIGGQLRLGPDVESIANIDYQVKNENVAKTEMFDAVKKYWPACSFHKLNYSYCGIRPKARMDGKLVNDFVIEGQEEHGVSNLINLFGIESPGLTSCLAIANLVLNKLGIEIRR
jgi:L-2-hydroxyglutarate oxidase LhgO